MGRLTLVVAALLGCASSAAMAGGGRHADPVRDVQGGPGPDITAVQVLQSGWLIRFQVGFSAASPFTSSTRQGFTDMLLVSISVHGKPDPTQCDYFLGVHAATLPQVVLARRQGGKKVTLAPALVAGRALTLDSRPIGTPKQIRFAVVAGREFSDGRGGGGDSAPDRGSYALTLAARPGATITVGQAANGKTIRLHVADTLVVRLPGNPTSGYRWSLTRLPSSLHLLASTYLPSTGKRLGQAGTYVFRFEARKGSGTLRLVYRRPWEQQKPPLRAFAVTTSVR